MSFISKYGYIVKSPLAISASGAILIFSGIGVVDYNRHIESTNSNIAMKSSAHLGEAMENMHDLASKHSLRFPNIYANRIYCVEMRYVYESAIKKRDQLLCDDDSDHDGKMSKQDAEDTVALEYHGFVMRMSRRALLRNGNIVTWAKAVTQDEFIKVFIVPIVSFFVIRSFRR